MKYTDVLRWTIFPDAHGQADRTERAIEYHWEHTDMFGFAGDMVNGPNSAGMFRLIRSLGAKASAIVGNHSWVLRNATSDSDDEMVQVWAEDVWPGYEEQSLISYGIHPTGKWLHDARALREVLRENGDLEWLRGLDSYIETPEFIVVHSGPELDKPWYEQAQYLDEVSQPDRLLHEEPSQIFSGKLGRVIDVPSLVDERTFVTGHLHLRQPIDQRSAQRKICLASPLDQGAPLYTWTSEDNKIHQHDL